MRKQVVAAAQPVLALSAAAKHPHEFALFHLVQLRCEATWSLLPSLLLDAATSSPPTSAVTDRSIVPTLTTTKTTWKTKKITKAMKTRMQATTRMMSTKKRRKNAIALAANQLPAVLPKLAANRKLAVSQRNAVNRKLAASHKV